MKVLNRQDLHDILVGCTVLGTGGGGELDEGIKMIDEDIRKGYEFRLVSLEEVPDDALIGSPYNAGSISPLSEEDKEKFKDLRVDKMYNVTSFKALEDFLGQKFYATISTELGGSNTAVAFSVAAKLGIPIIDGDPAGRSVPELQQSTFEMNNIPINPLSVATKFGDVIIIKEVIDGVRAEDIVRAIAVASQNTVGVTDHPILGKDIKNSVIPGAISYALKIGKALREARKLEKDVPGEVAKAGNGYVLFNGKVSDFNWVDEGGFTIGETYIEGQGEFEGDKYKIWYKNENLVAWKNGELMLLDQILLPYLIERMVLQLLIHI
ncbi:conserved hypothetical protein [[Clostridium] ultunense Esp]|nr:conserved hypothetical protein [[Clostridium] ultunense Esp]